MSPSSSRRNERLIKQLLSLLSILILLPQSAAQNTLECSCSPRVYRWTLDFDKVCPPNDVVIGSDEGIRDVFCQNTTNRPKKIKRYMIVEFGNTLQETVNVKNASNLNLKNGDTIEYESITASNKNIYTSGIKVTLSGKDDEGMDTETSWIVSYTNLCDVQPYTNGDSLSWTVFDNFTPASPSTCKGKHTKASKSSKGSKSSKASSKQPTLSKKSKGSRALRRKDTSEKANIETGQFLRRVNK